MIPRIQYMILKCPQWRISCCLVTIVRKKKKKSKLLGSFFSAADVIYEHVSEYGTVGNQKNAPSSLKLLIWMQQNWIVNVKSNVFFMIHTLTKTIPNSCLNICTSKRCQHKNPDSISGDCYGLA